MAKRLEKWSSDKLLTKVRAAVEKGDYFDTSHARHRKNQRKILRMEIEYILKNGWHEKKRIHSKKSIKLGIILFEGKRSISAIYASLSLSKIKC